jgi:hypothetical protein
MKLRIIVTLASIGILALSACVPAGVAVETTQPVTGRYTLPVPTNTPIPSKENPTPTPASQEAVVKQVESKLAENDNLSTGEIKLIQIEPVMWPDTCLGVEVSGVMCSQVVTPGYRVILETPQGTIEYHTDQTGQHIVLAPQVSPTSGSGIEGLVTLGPTCPGPTRIDDPKCQDQPYQATITIQNTSGLEVAQVSSDTAGKFQVELPAGTYTLHPETPNRFPTAQDMQVTVNAGEYTQVTIQYDSGMR